MKAAVITRYGGPEVIRIAEMPVPKLSDDEVLMEVEYAGVIYADLQLRAGTYFRDQELPYVLGHEAVGRVVKVGNAVRNVSEGQLVAAELSELGGYAEYAKTKANRVVAVPAGVAPEHALVYAFNLPAAYLVFYHFGKVRTPGWVLIHSAAGGLGGMLTQVAKRNGNKVIGLVSRESKTAECTANGADLVIVTDGVDFADKVLDATGSEGVDTIINHQVGESLLTDLSVLKPRGLWNIPSDVGGYAALRNVRLTDLFAKSPEIVRSSMESYLDKPEYAESLEFLANWLQTEDLRGPGHVFALDEVADAHELMASRASIGKIAIRIDRDGGA